MPDAGMEKYGVCKTCYGKPTCDEDLKSFTKTAAGYECPKCGQLMMRQLDLEDDLEVADDDDLRKKRQVEE